MSGKSPAACARVRTRDAERNPDAATSRLSCRGPHNPRVRIPSRQTDSRTENPRTDRADRPRPKTRCASPSKATSDPRLAGKDRCLASLRHTSARFPANPGSTPKSPLPTRFSEDPFEEAIRSEQKSERCHTTEEHPPPVLTPTVTVTVNPTPTETHTVSPSPVPTPTEKIPATPAPTESPSPSSSPFSPPTPTEQPEKGPTDEMAWEATRDAATIDAYEHYISNFPSGAHVLEANQWLIIPKSIELCNYDTPSINEGGADNPPSYTDSIDAYHAYTGGLWEKAFRLWKRIDSNSAQRLTSISKANKYYYSTFVNELETLSIARARIASMYRDGKFVTRNDAIGTKWYQKSFHTFVDIKTHNCRLVGWPMGLVWPSTVEYALSYIYVLGVENSKEAARYILLTNYSCRANGDNVLLTMIDNNQLPQSYDEYRRRVKSYVDKNNPPPPLTNCDWTSGR